MRYIYGIPTGIKGYDKKFSGVQGKGITVFTHESDYDMSAFAKYIACNASFIYKKNVLYLSAKDNIQTVIQFMGKYKNSGTDEGLLQFNSLPMSLPDFIKTVKEAFARHALDMVVINDIQLMNPQASRIELEELLDTLHVFSQEFSLPLIVTIPFDISLHTSYKRHIYAEVFKGFILAQDNQGRGVEIRYEMKT